MDPRLYETITSGQIDGLNQIASDNLLLQMTPLSNTTLHVAVQFDKIGCVKEICHRCPSLIIQPNSKGDTPLHIAARLGSSDIVAVLIGCANIIHHEDIERGGGLVEGSSSTTILKELVRMSNKENDTALHEAVRYHRFEVVKMLTEADPEFEFFANDAGETPLYLAAEDGLYVFMVQILETCSSSAHSGPRGWTALHVAAMSGNSDIAKLLLEKKPSTIIKEVDVNGCSAVHWAAYFAKVEVVVSLLEADSSVAYMSDRDGKTALYIAASSRMPRSLAHMLKKDGRIAREFVANTSIERSLSYELEKTGKATSLVADHKFRNERVEVIKEVSKRCPGCWELLDHNGKNFLHVAAEKGHLHVIKYVLKESKTMDYLINEKDNNGNTPLHLVLKSRSLECLRVLCEDDRVNKRAINKDNLSALDIVLDNLVSIFISVPHL